MLVLPAQLTHAQALSCLRMLAQGLDSQTEPFVKVDAAALESFDTSALAVLIEFRRECFARGKRLTVSGMSKPLIGLAKLYGIEELLEPI